MLPVGSLPGQGTRYALYYLSCSLPTDPPNALAICRQFPAVCPLAGAWSLPARLPRHLRPAHHGGKRRGHPRAGQPRPPAHRWRAVHQGLPLHRAQLPPRAHPHAPQAHGPQGQRPVCTRQLERSPGRDHAASRRHRSTQPRGHPSLQLRGHHGHGAGRRHGPALFSPPGRIATRPHHLRVGRCRSPGANAGRQGGHEGGVFCAGKAHPDLGQQFDWQQPAFLALCAAGQTQRRTAGMHRPAQDRNRRQVPRAHCPAPRHRCRAGPGTDARTDQERLAGPRLHNAPHTGLGAAARARPAVAARARGRGLRRARRADPPAGPRLWHHPARRHSPELRHAARARRRQRRARRGLPASAHRRLAPPRGRHVAVQLRPVSGAARSVAAARPDACAHATHAQHGANW